MVTMKQDTNCDVYVAGAGIAGLMAAISAAECHKKVMLSSSSQIFSGSSFYPGTWGLGVVSPENEADEEDMVQTILRVGCGMAQERMVRTFVEHMRPTIAWLKEQGLNLTEAEQKDQKEFIPCFDHKHRQWNGILAKEARAAFGRMLEQNHVIQCPEQELVELVQQDERICGVIVKDKAGTLKYIACGAVVLATGGYSGLYARRLTTSDILGTGQSLALEHGAKLVNMEFLQMMPGYIEPCTNTVFNEKTFRYVDLSGLCEQDLLEQRSGYGPFTSRLASREVDFLMENAGKFGLAVQYGKELKEQMPEFVKTYFDWLEQEKGITPEQTTHIGMFAHAANGGIQIDEYGKTGVDGLFACGEATGGMHGADRIGGLSTVNGFVFGRRCGQAAVQYLEQKKVQPCSEAQIQLWDIPQKGHLDARIQEIMSRCGFLIRQGEELEQGIQELQEMQHLLCHEETANVEDAVQARALEGRLSLAIGILRAQLLRKESRGSHYRRDYPQENPACAMQILIQKEEQDITAVWKAR
ncbi:MAG: FAD-binding protein [Lachnospiraceae bacterium]|nr:FAD-binding protein [Lachnospiraceae bacterium]